MLSDPYGEKFAPVLLKAKNMFVLSGGSMQVINTMPMDQTAAGAFRHFEPLYRVIDDMPRPPASLFDLAEGGLVLTGPVQGVGLEESSVLIGRLAAGSKGSQQGDTEGGEEPERLEGGGPDPQLRAPGEARPPQGVFITLISHVLLKRPAPLHKAKPAASAVPPNVTYLNSSL